MTYNRRNQAFVSQDGLDGPHSLAHFLSAHYKSDSGQIPAGTWKTLHDHYQVYCNRKKINPVKDAKQFFDWMKTANALEIEETLSPLFNDVLEVEFPEDKVPPYPKFKRFKRLVNFYGIKLETYGSLAAHAEARAGWNFIGPKPSRAKFRSELRKLTQVRGAKQRETTEKLNRDLIGEADDLPATVHPHSAPVLKIWVNDSGKHDIDYFEYPGIVPGDTKGLRALETHNNLILNKAYRAAYGNRNPSRGHQPSQTSVFNSIGKLFEFLIPMFLGLFNEIKKGMQDFQKAQEEFNPHREFTAKDLRDHPDAPLFNETVAKLTDEHLRKSLVARWLMTKDDAAREMILNDLRDALASEGLNGDLDNLNFRLCIKHLDAEERRDIHSQWLRASQDDKTNVNGSQKASVWLELIETLAKKDKYEVLDEPLRSLELITLSGMYDINNIDKKTSIDLMSSVRASYEQALRLAHQYPLSKTFPEFQRLNFEFRRDMLAIIKNGYEGNTKELSDLRKAFDSAKKQVDLAKRKCDERVNKFKMKYESFVAKKMDPNTNAFKKAKEELVILKRACDRAKMEVVKCEKAPELIDNSAAFRKGRADYINKELEKLIESYTKAFRLMDPVKIVKKSFSDLNKGRKDSGKGKGASHSAAHHATSGAGAGASAFGAGASGPAFHDLKGKHDKVGSDFDIEEPDLKSRGDTTNPFDAAGKRKAAPPFTPLMGSTLHRHNPRHPDADDSSLDSKMSRDDDVRGIRRPMGKKKNRRAKFDRSAH